MLSAYVQQINSLTNQLTDAGVLNNLGGGFLSKEFRKERTINQFRVGEWKKTEVPAQVMQTGLVPRPVQEPSQTLYTLNEKLDAKVKDIIQSTNIGDQLTAQTAPTTALAIIQEAMLPTSALFKRMLNAMSHEFQIIFRINQRVLDQEKYINILDDPEANVDQDFFMAGFDIVPTANAEMSTKMQRISTAQIELEQFPVS